RAGEGPGSRTAGFSVSCGRGDGVALLETRRAASHRPLARHGRRVCRAQADHRAAPREEAGTGTPELKSSATLPFRIRGMPLTFQPDLLRNQAALVTGGGSGI